MSIADKIEKHGPAALEMLEGFARDHGEDFARWVVERFQARRKAKRRRARDEAIADVRETAAERKARGEGHE